jgi:C1A family cysteine protease
MADRKYPLKRESEDVRDLKAAVTEAVKLPQKVDLRAACPPIFDQGSLGSCTANAGAAAYIMTYMPNRASDAEISRLYLYYMERFLEGTTAEDAGASMRSIGKALNKYGVCEEPLWPYIVEKYAEDPPDAADIDAGTRMIKAYSKLSDISQIKRYLANNKLPVMIGIEVYESFETEAVGNTGIVPMPKAGENCLGGHAIDIVGYDDDFGKKIKSGCALSNLIISIYKFFAGAADSGEDGYFIFRNSWGNGWGDGGYGYLPYAFVREHAYDFWVLE